MIRKYCATLRKGRIRVARCPWRLSCLGATLLISLGGQALNAQAPLGAILSRIPAAEEAVRAATAATRLGSGVSAVRAAGSAATALGAAHSVGCAYFCAGSSTLAPPGRMSAAALANEALLGASAQQARKRPPALPELLLPGSNVLKLGMRPAPSLVGSARNPKGRRVGLSEFKRELAESSLRIQVDSGLPARALAAVHSSAEVRAFLGRRALDGSWRSLTPAAKATFLQLLSVGATNELDAASRIDAMAAALPTESGSATESASMPSPEQRRRLCRLASWCALFSAHVAARACE